jgi:hypothetical protein
VPDLVQLAPPKPQLDRGAPVGAERKPSASLASREVPKKAIMRPIGGMS